MLSSEIKTSYSSKISSTETSYYRSTYETSQITSLYATTSLEKEINKSSTHWLDSTQNLETTHYENTFHTKDTITESTQIIPSFYTTLYSENENLTTYEHFTGH